MNNFKLSKIDQIIIYCLLFSIPLAIAVYLTYWRLSGPSYEEAVLISISEETYFGKIDSLYFDLKNHNVKKAVSKNGVEFIIPRNWEKFVLVGDSLVKKKGSLLLEIHHLDSSVHILNYKGRK